MDTGLPVFAAAGLEFSRLSDLEVKAVREDAGAALGTGIDQFDSDAAKLMRADIAGDVSAGEDRAIHSFFG